MAVGALLRRLAHEDGMASEERLCRDTFSFSADPASFLFLVPRLVHFDDKWESSSIERKSNEGDEVNTSWLEVSSKVWLIPAMEEREMRPDDDRLPNRE